MVPKNELITDVNVLAFTKSSGVKISLSLTFILSLIVLAILERPTPNWPANCSPTVLILLLERWSISSTSVLEFANSIKCLTIEIISSLVRTSVVVGILSPNFLFNLYRPTSPKEYLCSEKNSFSIIPLAVSSSGGSALRN